MRQKCFLLYIIYYTNSHLAKNYSGNNFFFILFLSQVLCGRCCVQVPSTLKYFAHFSGCRDNGTPYNGSKIDKKSFFFTIFLGIFHNTRNMSCIFNQAISFQKKFQAQPYPLRAIKTKKNTWPRVSHIQKLRNSKKSENPGN